MRPFLLGFVIGVAIGAAAVIIGAPRSGPAQRASISDFWTSLLETARHAAAEREQELWAEFRQRLGSE